MARLSASPQTAPLFQKWLYYGLATIFSGVMLGVMTEISMDLVGNLFGGATAGDFVAKVIGGGSQTAIMDTVTQQLGLGVILCPFDYRPTYGRYVVQRSDVFCLLRYQLF